MEIKVLAFISLLPILYILRKVGKRDCLTCADIIIVFYTLFFSVIPLFSDPDYIIYNYVKDSSAAHWYTFFVYNAFIYSLIILDCILKTSRKYYYSLYNITYIISNWSEKYVFTYKTPWLLTLFITIQMLITLQEAATGSEMVLNNVKEVRDMASQSTPFQIFLHTANYIVRLTVVFFLTVLVVKKSFVPVSKSNKYKYFLYLLIISEFYFHLLVSRTYLFESMSLVLLVIYSIKRNVVKNRDIVKGLVVICAAVVLLFPILSGIRLVNKLMANNNITTSNFVEVMAQGFDLYMSGQISLKDADNKASRSWYVYQIVAYTNSIPYEGNGELTLNAISYGIPKIINPNKSLTGSQLLIEEKTHTYEDISDSLLLLGQMENRYFGFLITLFYFFAIMISYFFLYVFFKKFDGGKYSTPIIISAVYIWLNRVDSSFDNWIPYLLHIVVFFFISYILIRLLLSNSICKKSLQF